MSGVLGLCGPERKTMTKPDTDRRPVLRGRPKNPESVRHDADVPRLKGCPDCGGRGYYLIQPFMTGGSNGAGGLGNMCHCLTCVDSKAYWDEFGELPPSVVADMDRVSIAPSAA